MAATQGRRRNTVWRATMVSRMGLLPEDDFWSPSCPPPLEIFSESAACALATGKDGALAAIFALFDRR
ncbi:hypothetical protein CCR94_15660 [Rhodoblastus sphagnicola]|uniref:Uncharacterized protein n=1 Tax=Rhodoblastus sphagnicola TaxID=333368 RepID=A0A2S6N3Q1_9HYPH|nr:hypothetical protein CCR94_15660 [Rhodoblastus sphagnicola]